VLEACVPNHSLRTGALTFLPVVPPESIFTTSTPRYASAVYELGIDRVFSDFPDTAVVARAYFWNS
jgi:glycerophosphoryl diester phosphodiesterase